MSSKSALWCAGGLVLLILGTCPVCTGQDNNNGNDQNAPRQDAGQGGRGNRGGFPMMGRGNTRFMDGMLNRSIGIEQTAKVEDLPFGEAKRLVRDVPVGGVDGLQEGRDGWKVEEIFTLTPEQIQALTTLREEYKNELAKHQTEYDEMQKALAEKVKALRLLYETKANDVLTDPAKAEKLKLDALAKEFATENETQLKERTAQINEFRTNMEKTMEEARQNNDWGNLRDAFGKVHELVRGTIDQRTNLAKSFNDKMKEAVTGAAKDKLEELLKPEANRGNPQWGRGPGGGPGGGRDRGGDRGGQRQGGGAAPAGGGGTGDKPPAPPEF